MLCLNKIVGCTLGSYPYGDRGALLGFRQCTPGKSTNYFSVC